MDGAMGATGLLWDCNEGHDSLEGEWDRPASAS